MASRAGSGDGCEFIQTESFFGITAAAERRRKEAEFERLKKEREQYMNRKNQEWDGWVHCRRSVCLPKNEDLRERLKFLDSVVTEIKAGGGENIKLKLVDNNIELAWHRKPTEEEIEISKNDAKKNEELNAEIGTYVSLVKRLNALGISAWELHTLAIDVIAGKREESEK